MTIARPRGRMTRICRGHSRGLGCTRAASCREDDMREASSLRNVIAIVAVALLAGLPPRASGQAWKPERPVELIVGCAPGCGPDNMARLMQRVFQVNHYFDQAL